MPRWQPKYYNHMKIRKGDTVKIICGKDRGKTGKVFAVYPKAGKATIEGMNLVKKHRKPRRGGEKGQKIEIAKPMDISNIMLICPKCGQPARVGYKLTETDKFRICKKCQQEI